MSLFWKVIGVGRWTDILHWFRLQRRGEAGARKYSLRPVVERTLDVSHRERRRHPTGLDWSVATSDSGHGDGLSKTSRLLGVEVVGRPR